MKNKNLIFSIVALLFFAVLAVIYCSPVLSDNAILQPDIVNYTGGAQEMRTFEAETGENIYWSNAMFGGMPTYQSGARYQYDLIKKIDHTLRFLPRPADYIFLLFGGFFLLGMILFRNWKYALAGSVFFAMAAYFYIIIGAGHNAKVHAIAYFAPLTAGVILLYRGKFILGFLLTALFMGLELSANHPQMTYYLFLVLMVFFFVELWDALRFKKIRKFLTATALVAAATFIGIGLNSSRLLTTWEYSQETTRGQSEMTLLQTNDGGLDHDYITHWSYGKLETFNLFIPDFMGGGNYSIIPKYQQNYSQQESAKFENTLKEFNNQAMLLDMSDQFNAQAFDYLTESPVNTYWGAQPGTSGPAYQGAVVGLLFFLGLFLVRNKWGKYKWWLLSATILSIILAWGKNFAFLTNFMIDYFPFYDKFRAVSSMLVMAELTMPMLAALTLFVFFKDEKLSDEFKKKILLYAGGGVVALLVLFYLAGGSLFSFTTDYDLAIKKQYLELVQEYNSKAYGTWSILLDNLNHALRQDRIAMFKADTLRTLIFVILTLGLLFLWVTKKIKNKLIVVLSIALLALIDGWQVDKRYLNDENFVHKMFVQNPFPTERSTRLMNAVSENPMMAGIAQKTAFNKTLDSLRQADKSQYRVFDGVNSTFNDATTSYFAHSIGGYHGAKLHNYQDIIDLYFSGSAEAEQYGISSAHLEKMLNLLNAKYLVLGNLSSPMVQMNPNAYGNVWLVNNIKEVPYANEEILALKDADLRNEVVLETKFVAQLKDTSFQSDSISTIELMDYQPDKLVYKANIHSPKIAVFSEIYYPHGWKVTVNGQSRPILKADYLLRAVELQKGDNEIIMEFDPPIVKTGKRITMGFNVLFTLLIIGGIFLLWKKRQNNSMEAENSKSSKN
ncbi:MAG: YfhO family protein [Weeksellaceae bacterium]